jgi:hypothetical protein
MKRRRVRVNKAKFSIEGEPLKYRLLSAISHLNNEGLTFGVEVLSIP